MSAGVGGGHLLWWSEFDEGGLGGLEAGPDIGAVGEGGGGLWG